MVADQRTQLPSEVVRTRISFGISGCDCRVGELKLCAESDEELWGYGEPSESRSTADLGPASVRGFALNRVQQELRHSLFVAYGIDRMANAV